MIHTRLAGGLGNQLFQFAATLALRGDAPLGVALCTDALQRYRAQRSFDLVRLLDLPPGCVADPPGLAQRAAAALLRLRIGRLLPRGGVNDRNFARQLGRRRSSWWLDGYFQSRWPSGAFEAACARIRPLQRRDLPPSRVPRTDCAMHVRGGDFLSSEVHRVVDARYYAAALAALRTQRPALRTVCVVTDDAAHAAPIVAALQQAQPDALFSLAPPPDTGAGPAWLQDFVLLRDAPARVIGNSTFAWWAAALDARRAPTASPDQWMRGVPRDLYLPWETCIAA